MSFGSGSSRTSDPFARKAGFDAMQRMDSGASSSSSSSYNKAIGQQQQQGNKNPWGPVFKNKAHFAEMHWC